MDEVKKGKRFSDGQRGNTRGHAINGASRKDERRKDAFAREEKWRALSISERIKRLPKEGANRERARLEAKRKIKEKTK